MNRVSLLITTLNANWSTGTFQTSVSHIFAILHGMKIQYNVIAMALSFKRCVWIHITLALCRAGLHMDYKRAGKNNQSNLHWRKMKRKIEKYSSHRTISIAWAHSFVVFFSLLLILCQSLCHILKFHTRLTHTFDCISTHTYFIVLFLSLFLYI